MMFLYIPSTKVTPEISFNVDNKQFSIKGYSRPEDVELFYSQIFTWINDKTEALAATGGVTITIDIIYFNSSSARQLLKLLNLIHTATNEKSNFIWYYELEDEELLESGKEFYNIIKANFSFIAK